MKGTEMVKRRTRSTLEVFNTFPHWSCINLKSYLSKSGFLIETRGNLLYAERKAAW